MNVPPWQPPKIAPFAPAQAQNAPSFAPVAVGRELLRAPLWNPQEGESGLEHAAFLSWLMGGYSAGASTATTDKRVTVRGDWAAALGTLGGTRDQVQALSVKWSWEVRGREYWTTTRAIGEAAVQAHEAGVLEFAALARERDRLWLELEILELRKAHVFAKCLTPGLGQERAPEFLPRLLDNRELIALYRAAGALEIHRTRAGLIDKLKDQGLDESITDWTRLSPTKLDEFRRLREEARAVK